MHFKRDEKEGDIDLTVDGNHILNIWSSFKYRSSLITTRSGVKIAVPLKDLSYFWRSVEMPLINCKVELSLIWDPNCALSNLVGAWTFSTTDAKLYVLIVTLSTEDNAKLSILSSKGFKGPVYWVKYKTITNKKYDENVYIRERLDASYEGVKRLFILAYRGRGGANRVIGDPHKRYFLLRVKISNYNIEIEGRIFYDQPINE